jgi:hypothetical protein
MCCAVPCCGLVLCCRILKAALAGTNKQLQQEMTRDPAGQGGKILVTGIATTAGTVDACCSSTTCLAK